MASFIICLRTLLKLVRSITFENILSGIRRIIVVTIAAWVYLRSDSSVDTFWYFMKLTTTEKTYFLWNAESF